MTSHQNNVPEEEITHEEKELHIDNAEVKQMQGGIKFYKWRDIAAGSAFTQWTTRIPNHHVISGGIHVIGYYKVYITDSWPDHENNRWSLTSYNAGNTVDVDIWAVGIAI